MGSVCAILVVQLQIRPGLFVSPPVFPDRGEKGADFRRYSLMYLVHVGLDVRLIPLRPGFVDDGNSAGLVDPSVEAAGGCEKTFLRAERVGVLLENDVVVATIPR